MTFFLAEDTNRVAESIIEIGICQLQMNSLNNAQKTFQRAFKIHTETNNIEGICDARMHLSAAMQRLTPALHKHKFYYFIYIYFNFL